MSNAGLHLATDVSVTISDGVGTILQSFAIGEVPAATALESFRVHVTRDAWDFGPLHATVGTPAYDDCNADDDEVLIALPCE